MLPFPDYDRYDGLGLAALIRSGDVSAAEVCEAAIARIAARNPALGAVITRMDEIGRRTAQAIDRSPGAGAFAGVPFLLKDLMHAYAGVPLSGGSAALRQFVPDHDSTLVRRFKEAGLLVLGKTNVPEFGLMGVTEPEAFGPARNPWDLERTPGGSSGGSAAAVAARLVPLASANDGGGSIRIPAACCGLFGLKPTRGRVPVGPDYGEAWDGAVCDGAITRTVRDSAALLDAVAGPEPGAPYQVLPPEQPYLTAIQTPPRPLRIAFTTCSPLGTPVDPACKEAVEQTARRLQDLGHAVEPAEPEIDGPAVARAYLMLYFGQMAADLDWVDEVMGEGASKQVEDATRALGLIGRSLPAGTYVASKRGWNAFARAMARFHARYDLYLTPTLAAPPARIGALMPSGPEVWAMRLVTALRAGRLLFASGIVDRLATESFKALPFTQLANLTGQPAMSVPMHWTEDGLPVGVQFIAPFGDETTLFRLAAQLEAAHPWGDRVPPFVQTASEVA